MQHRITPSPKTPRTSRRPSRVTIVVATATAATALLTAAAAASGSASTRPIASGLPATHAAAAHGKASLAVPAAAPARQAAAQAIPPQAIPAQASQAQASPSHAAPAQPGARAHLTVDVGQRRSGQPQHRAAAKAPAKPAAPARPYQMYDSVTPSAIPAHQAVAAYSTGTYSASPAQLRGLGHAIWIDTTGYNYAASALDVEPGDATPSQAASWAWHRLHANPGNPVRIYTFLSQWPAVQAAVHGLPGWMQSRVHYWIADPTGTPHIVPGSWATQWYWGSNYDVSIVKPGF